MVLAAALLDVVFENVADVAVLAGVLVRGTVLVVRLDRAVDVVETEMVLAVVDGVVPCVVAEVAVVDEACVVAIAVPEIEYPEPPTVAYVSVPYMTFDPGLGNTTSSFSIVVHPFPTLQTKTSGKESKEVWRFLVDLRRLLDVDPSIVTRAQFMYISRLPTWLNHVHAKRASVEDGASLGIVKLYFVVKGHPPIIDSMTLKVFPLSYDNDN